MSRTKGLIYGVLCLLLLSGCGNMALELNKDGSGKVAIEVDKNGYISKEEIENELESEFNDEEGVSGLNVKERDEKLEAHFQFDDLSKLDSNAFLVPVSDYATLEDARLESLKKVDEYVNIDETSSGILATFPSGLNDFDQAEVILPGNIMAHSQDIDMIKDDRIDISAAQDEVYVVYEPESNIGTWLWGSLIVIVAGGAGVFYYRRRKKAKTPEYNESGDVHA